MKLTAISPAYADLAFVRARRCTGLTSGLGTNAIDVTNGHPLIKPSYDAQNHARGSERYHTSEGIERGLDRVRARARTAPRPTGMRGRADRRCAANRDRRNLSTAKNFHSAFMPA